MTSVYVVEDLDGTKLIGAVCDSHVEWTFLPPNLSQQQHELLKKVLTLTVEARAKKVAPSDDHA